MKGSLRMLAVCDKHTTANSAAWHELKQYFSHRSFTSSVGPSAFFALLLLRSQEALTCKWRVGRLRRLASSIRAASAFVALLDTTPVMRGGTGRCLLVLIFLHKWVFRHWHRSCAGRLHMRLHFLNKKETHCSSLHEYSRYGRSLKWLFSLAI